MRLRRPVQERDVDGLMSGLNAAWRPHIAQTTSPKASTRHPGLGRHGCSLRPGV